MISGRMDKNHLSVADLKDDDQVAFWRSRPVAERFQAIETMRQIAFGYDPATARLQRFFEIAQLHEG